MASSWPHLLSTPTVPINSMTDHPIKSPRKLIEVALPLDAINVACAREKSIRHGHPSTLHLWWARRPLAAARALRERGRLPGQRVAARGAHEAVALRRGI